MQITWYCSCKISAFLPSAVQDSSDLHQHHLGVDDRNGNIDFMFHKTWWRHQMEPFSALLALCAGNSSVTGEFPTQRPVTRSFDVFSRLNKLLSKQTWGWWFETPSRSVWHHCYENQCKWLKHDLHIRELPLECLVSQSSVVWFVGFHLLTSHCY